MGVSKCCSWRNVITPKPSDLFPCIPRLLEPWISSEHPLALDSELILASVRKTRRVVIVDEAHQTCNAGAEIAAQVADSAFDCLDAPVKRVSSFDCHIAYAPPLEEFLVPSPQRIEEEVRTLL